MEPPLLVLCLIFICLCIYFYLSISNVKTIVFNLFITSPQSMYVFSSCQKNLYCFHSKSVESVS